MTKIKLDKGIPLFDTKDLPFDEMEVNDDSFIFPPRDDDEDPKKTQQRAQAAITKYRTSGPDTEGKRFATRVREEEDEETSIVRKVVRIWRTE